MKFLVDAQLPPALARWFTAQGHIGLHVQDFGMLDASDGDIWSRAIADDLVLVTKDRDFVDWMATRLPAPRVMWLRIGNISNHRLFTRMTSRWPAIVEGLEGPDPIVQVL